MGNASSSTTRQSSSSTASPSSGRGRGRRRGPGATTISLADSSAPPSEAPRGRGKSRGGLGKYLRARGRGRGSGRPAEFHGRLLLLDGDKVKQTEEDDDEEQRERAQKYSRRKLGTNTDRYKEEEPELDSDGAYLSREPILPPEIDLSSFLERQLNLDVDAPILKTVDINEDDVDYSLAHISSRGIANPDYGKGKIEEIEWDDDMDEMTREKTTELTSRFRAKSEKLKKKPIAPTTRERKQEASYVAAPALPTEQILNPKDEMQDFLDDLLT
ncbi:hypothetical protein BDZ89DRAFT_945505 [Hymenopellis radicata]|nr:hypothetical protein BDZ89DRAFT_945505 [Hymenopellis radicata]